MPTDPDLPGFGNQWFARAFPAAHFLRLPSGITIRVLPSPYFLATKNEAFHHHGAGDFFLSRDVEDVVAIMEGRLEIVKEVKNAENDLRDYVAGRLSQWPKNPDFMDALPGLLPPDAASQARASIIIERVEMMMEE